MARSSCWYSSSPSPSERECCQAHRSNQRTYTALLACPSSSISAGCTRTSSIKGFSRSHFTIALPAKHNPKGCSIPFPAPARCHASATAGLPRPGRSTTLCDRSHIGGGMFKHLHFPILVINPDCGRGNVAGQQLNELFDELRHQGFEVLATTSLDEGRLVAEAHRGLSCILFSAENDHQQGLDPVRKLFLAAHSRSPELPIIALSTTQSLDNQLLSNLRDLHQLRGIIYLFEDTMPFIAGQIARTAR